MRELIVGIFLGISAMIMALAHRKLRLEKESKKREDNFRAELERTERQTREKSLSDNIDRANKLLNDSERKKP